MKVLTSYSKTQLAIQAALNWYKARPNWSIFWIDGRSWSHIQSSCQYLVQLVRPPGYDPKQPPEDWVAHFLAWLVSERSGSWLLLVDNIDDKQLLVPFITQLTRGPMLITSRDSSVTVLQFPVQHHPEAITVRVGVLAREEALQMLLQRRTHLDHPTKLPSEGTSAYSHELEDTEELVTELGYLPLAIAQAGSFMAKTKITPHNYSKLLKDGAGSKKQLLDEEFREHRGSQDLPNAVTKTWAISFEEIRRVSPLSTQLLAMVGVLDPEGCPEYLLSSMSADKDLEASIQILYDFSFIISQEHGSVRTHPLVYEAIRQYLYQQQTLDYWKVKALRLVSGKFLQVTESEDWRTCREMLPHAETVLEYAKQLLPHSGDYRTLVPEEQDCWKLWLDLLSAMSTYHKATSVLRRAKSLLEEARRVANIMNLTNTERALDLQTDLSVVLARLGDLASAEDLEERTLRQRKLLPGPGQSGITKSMTNLASFYRAGGKLEKARHLASDTLRIRRESEEDSENGCELPATQDAMLELAAIYIALGDLVRAEALQVQVNDVRSLKLGSSHPLTLQGRNELAATYGMQERYRDAEDVLSSVVAEGTLLYGAAQHKSTWSSTANLAVVYRSQQRWAEAASLDRKLLDVVPEVHPISLVLKENLAVTLREWGHRTKNRRKLGESLTLVRDVVEARIDTLGRDAPDTLTALLQEAQTLWYLGDDETALHMMEDVYDSRTKSYGPEHPDSLSTLLMITELKADTQPWNMREVVDMQESILKIRQKVLGPKHPDTLDVETRLDVTTGSRQDLHSGYGHQYSNVVVRDSARQHLGDFYGGSYVNHVR